MRGREDVDGALVLAAVDNSTTEGSDAGEEGALYSN